MAERLINLIKQSAEESPFLLNTAAKARVKQLVLQRISGQNESFAASTVRVWRQRYFAGVFRYGAILAGILVFASAGAAYASQQALPGDLLYPVKLGVEKVQLDLAFTQQQKIQLATQFTGKRIEELQTLSAQQENPPVSNQQNPPLAVSGQHQTPTPMPAPQPQTDNNSRVNQAQAQVDQALNNLQQTQQQLQQTGQNTAAANLGQTIIGFKDRVKQLQQTKKGGHNKSNPNGTPGSPDLQNAAGASSSTSTIDNLNGKGKNPPSNFRLNNQLPQANRNHSKQNNGNKN